MTSGSSHSPRFSTTRLERRAPIAKSASKKRRTAIRHSSRSRSFPANYYERWFYFMNPGYCDRIKRGLPMASDGPTSPFTLFSDNGFDAGIDGNVAKIGDRLLDAPLDGRNDGRLRRRPAQVSSESYEPKSSLAHAYRAAGLPRDRYVVDERRSPKRRRVMPVERRSGSRSASTRAVRSRRARRAHASRAPSKERFPPSTAAQSSTDAISAGIDMFLFDVEPARKWTMLRAMRAVALADGTLSPKERALLEVSKGALGLTGDLDSLAPFDLAEAAGADAERIVQAMILMAIMDGAAAPEEAALGPARGRGARRRRRRARRQPTTARRGTLALDALRPDPPRVCEGRTIPYREGRGPDWPLPNVWTALGFGAEPGSNAEIHRARRISKRHGWPCLFRFDHE